MLSLPKLWREQNYVFVNCNVIWCTNKPTKSKSSFCSDHSKCSICQQTFPSNTHQPPQLTISAQTKDGIKVICHTDCYNQKRYDRIAIPVCYICGIPTNCGGFLTWGWEYLCKDHNICLKCKSPFPSNRQSQFPDDNYDNDDVEVAALALAAISSSAAALSSAAAPSSVIVLIKDYCECTGALPILPLHCYLTCKNSICKVALHSKNQVYCRNHLTCDICKRIVTIEEPAENVFQYRLKQRCITSGSWEKKISKVLWCHAECKPELHAAIGHTCSVCRKESVNCVEIQKHDDVWYEYVCKLHSFCFNCVQLLPCSSIHRQSIMNEVKCTCLNPIKFPTWNHFSNILIFAQEQYSEEEKNRFIHLFDELLKDQYNNMCAALHRPHLKRRLPSQPEDHYAENQKSRMECQICYNFYETPLALPCGHVFCQKCIAHITFCAVCRQTFTAQDLKRLFL